MTQDRVRNQIVRAVSLAKILTGHVDLAEIAVMEAIEAIPSGDTSDTSLLAEVCRASWQMPPSVLPRRPKRTQPADRIGPIELQRLSKLPKKLRYCFAMRMLTGISADVCGQITGLGRDQVLYLVHLAVQILARPARTSREQLSVERFELAEGTY